MSAGAEIVRLALELERQEAGAPDGRYRVMIERSEAGGLPGRLLPDGSVVLPPGLVQRLGLQPGDFVTLVDAAPAAAAPAAAAAPPVGEHWWTDEGTCGRCHSRASLVAGMPCAWRPDGAPEAGLRSDPRSDPALPLNYDERRELTGIFRSLEDAWVGHDFAQAVPKALARALGAVAELHTRLMAIVEALPLDDARHRLEQLRCLRVPQEIELDATRPCPDDARERFLSLWESIPATYHPHPSESSRRRFVPMHHLELPRPVCKGAFADGRRFLALRLVEEYAQQPRIAGRVQAAEERVAGVAHERDPGPASPWVWTGTSHGALGEGLADPALVEALLAGRVVRQPEGFSLVVPSGPRRCLQCGERPPQPTGSQPLAQAPEGDPPV